MTAECHNNAHGIFDLDDVHNVFFAQRLKIKSVGRIEIRRYSLGVVVDYYRLIAELLNGMDGVDGRIVKLNALSYTDRT